MDDRTLPDLRAIGEAARRIAGVASRTPLVESPVLSRRTGREVFLKLECFQPVMVFKIRGAYNKLSQLSERSVVAATSGNHGIAVAYSAHILGKKATIVVPETAVREKVDAIESYGAKVTRAGTLSHEREAKAREIARATGSAFVHPFDDPQVIAGQGTCGLEIVDQLSEFDSILVPVGGGGLISGISIVLKALRPEVKVFGVEPTGAPKLSAALKAERIITIASPHSIADGLLPSRLSDLTFSACAKNVDGAFTVTEDEIRAATRTMVNEVRIVAEPSGAAPLAPLLRQTSNVPGGRVVVVVSGGNISNALLKQVLG